MIHDHFWLYLLVTAGTTYLVRMLPLVLMRRKITNRFVLSFLHYIPYAVLSVMTIPAIFFATGQVLPAAVGFVVAVALAWRGGSLVQVAAASCGAVLLCELML
jgi:branched-subunit amino acid transport protein